MKNPSDGSNFNSVIELTEEQKQKILTLWNSSPNKPPSIRQLSTICFGRDTDGRSSEGRAMRQFLATRNLKAGPYQQSQGEIKLRQEQEEFIKNNHLTMTSLEMARTLFNDSLLVGTNLEVKAVKKFVDLLQTPGKLKEDLITEEWKPPAKMSELLVRLNKYAAKDYDVNKLKPVEKKNFTVLMSYLKTYRFRQQISTYSSLQDSELFESEFIRCTYDKPDLSSEEIDQYVIYSAEVVISRNILKSIELFQKEQELALQSNERINMGLVEATSSLRKEYNECVNRQQKLLNMLTQKRSDRLDSQIQANASILSLVEEFVSEQTRQKLIKIAQERQQVVSEEFDRLEGLSELKFRIVGMDKNLAMNG